MVNRDVAVLPEERRPAARKCPDPAEPAIEELRGEDRAMGVVVEVDADVDSGDPAQDHGRSQDKSYARPWPGYTRHSGMQVEPECASIRRKADEVKDYAVPILRIGEKAPGPQRCRGREVAGLWNHRDLKAAAIATTVTPRLTQGPQSAAPTIITIAKSGKKDRPKISPIGDTYVRKRRPMVSSFPLRLGWGVV